MFRQKLMPIHRITVDIFVTGLCW